VFKAGGRAVFKATNKQTAGGRAVHQTPFSLLFFLTNQGRAVEFSLEFKKSNGGRAV
jgi:hypothetical protein